MANPLIPVAMSTPPCRSPSRRSSSTTGGASSSTIRDGVAYTASELPGPGFNFAACLGRCPPLAAVLPTARAFFADADQGWGILVEGDAGHPVESAVQAAGWAVAEDEPAFVRPDLADLGTTDGPAGLVLRPIADPTDVETFRRVCTAAFEAPPEIADLIMPSLGFARDPAMLWLLGEVGGVAVAAGGYHRVGDVAVIGGLATLTEHRGRGVGAALARACLTDARGKGCRAGALRSGPKSVPLYERLGFRYACQHRTYAAPADG